MRAIDQPHFDGVGRRGYCVAFCHRCCDVCAKATLVEIHSLRELMEKSLFDRNRHQFRLALVIAATRYKVCNREICDLFVVIRRTRYE